MRWIVTVVLALFAGGTGLHADSSSDPITRLQQQLNSGEVKLEFDDRWGYLPSLLEALSVPRSSQVLVFSKTSAQFRLISPGKPRAVYFNDDVYVGWVQKAPFLEISAADPTGGAVFFTLDQEETSQPKFQRDRGECLECHETARTLRVPGHLTRSVYPGPDGHPHLSQGSTNVDQTTPLEKRFGGWYVTGSGGAVVHLGNATIEAPEQAEELDAGPGSGLTELSSLIDVEEYLTPHSDIIAHLLLGHQTQMHNYIARAALETRRALDHLEQTIELFGEADEESLASIRRRIEHPSEDLLRYMLFVDEVTFQAPVMGTAPFGDEFQQQGPRDRQGRSLRDLDLKTRLLRYPCSFLIYSDAFRDLPPRVKEYVYRRLDEVLTGKDRRAEFAHLSAGDRSAIREILADTLPEAAEYWTRSGG